MRRRYVEITRELGRQLKKRKEALVLSGAVLDTEGLDEDVLELASYSDDGTAEIRRWTNDVQRNAC